MSYLDFIAAISRSNGRRITLARVARSGHSLQQLFAYLLMPGFTQSYHSAVLSLSRGTIRRYLVLAQKAAAADPDLARQASAAAATIDEEEGLRLGLSRRNSHLPHWTRLALCQEYHRARNFAEVAKTFGCSRSTVRRAVRGGCLSYHPLSAERSLAPRCWARKASGSGGAITSRWASR